MIEDFMRISLAEILSLERRPVIVMPDQLYTEIGIYSFGRGIFHKTPRTGLEVGNKDLFLIKNGDFILQITFAWEGAIGLASEEDDNLYGSVRFPTFRVNESICFPKYLVNYFKTKEGRDQLVRISPGSAGRNRVLSMKRLSEVLVPLPPLKEQRRIVARIEELANKIARAKGLNTSVSNEVLAIKSAYTDMLLNHSKKNTLPVFHLGNIADIRAGVTLGRLLTSTAISVPYLRVANVQDDHLDLNVIKEINIYPDELDKWRLEDGDILLTEGGDWDKLGRGTVWRGEIPNCIHQNHIFRVRIDQNEFEPDFLAAYIGSPYGKKYFQNASKKTTNLASINQKQLKALKVIKPPLATQKKIVSQLNDLQSKIDALKQKQTETASELNALLPSILDKAFKGEL